MKLRWGAATIGAIALMLSTAGASSAGTHSVSIINCTYTGYGYSTQTTATRSGSGCESTNARIKRVVNGSILTYDGVPGSSSVVSASNGYLYNNYHYARTWYACT